MLLSPKGGLSTAGQGMSYYIFFEEKQCTIISGDHTRKSLKQSNNSPYKDFQSILDDDSDVFSMTRKKAHPIPTDIEIPVTVLEKSSNEDERIENHHKEQKCYGKNKKKNINKTNKNRTNNEIHYERRFNDFTTPKTKLVSWKQMLEKCMQPNWIGEYHTK